MTSKCTHRKIDEYRLQHLLSLRQRIWGGPNRDHVPPLQFFPKRFRKDANPDLLTLLVHPECNSEYQSDEDYFVTSFAALVMDSPAGGELLNDISVRAKKSKHMGLYARILREFESRPSGIYLPEGRVVKRFDTPRITRVIWKITKGLFQHHLDRYLPDNVPKMFDIYVHPDEPPPNVLVWAVEQLNYGPYPAVFSYCFDRNQSVDDQKAMDIHLWAFLFWDKVLCVVSIHDPLCSCPLCG